MDEWHVGDPADWGDSVGVPDIHYMGYLNNDEDEDDDAPPCITYSESLSDEAWRLRNEGRLGDALSKINKALETCGNARNYNRKAIILEDLGRNDEALTCYDKAIRRSNDPIISDNKARLLARLAEHYSSETHMALKRINAALKLTSNEDDRLDFLRTKSDVLQRLGRVRDSYVCLKLAEKEFDKVDEFEKHAKTLKKSRDTLICITGTGFYQNLTPFSEGVIVDLIKEPNNEHDSDAVRVDANSQTVGYVSNSPLTRISETKSASDIKNLFESHTKAQVMFIFMEKYVIAKLID